MKNILRVCKLVLNVYTLYYTKGYGNENSSRAVALFIFILILVDKIPERGNSCTKIGLDKHNKALLDDQNIG